MAVESAPKVLVADDDPDGLYVITTLLEQQGYRVVTANRGDAAFDLCVAERPDLLVIDVSMPGLTGYEVAARVKKDRDLRFIPILLVTAKGSLEEIIHGLAQGADDYVVKPYQKDELLARIAAALRIAVLYRELQATQNQNEILKTQVAAARGVKQTLLGESSAMRAAHELIARVAASHLPVLITGESGTGKELAAKAIHAQSPRNNAPLIAQNCSAFNENLLESELFGHVRGAFSGAVRDKEGLFGAADGGTLFLDELGEMSVALQAKLLRVLQDGTFFSVGSTKSRQVDVRLIAATNRNLEVMVKAGTFREDLFYRISVLPIELPPLRKRREDIPLLLQHFLNAEGVRSGKAPKRFDADALKILLDYDWPGNVRQLQNEIERDALLAGDADIITVDLLSPVMRRSDTPTMQDVGASLTENNSLKDSVASYEKEVIRKALTRHDGNRTHAAKDLSLSRSSLLAKMRAYGLE